MSRTFRFEFDPRRSAKLDAKMDTELTVDQEASIAREHTVAEEDAVAEAVPEEDPAVIEVRRLRRLRAADEFTRDAALEKFVRDATRGRAGSRSWVKTRIN